MNKIIIYAAIGFIIVSGAWYPAVPWLFLLAWIMLSLSAVGLAYSKNWAMLFRKSENGAIPNTIRWLFFPFLIGVQIYNGFIRFRDPMPPVQKIADKLYQGARLVPGEVALLKDEDIHSVLDLTAEFDGLGSFADEDSAVNYLNIPVLDHMVPTHDQMNHACRWIAEQHEQGRNVMIHCALGRGRASFMVAAYLLQTNHHSNVEDAMQHISGIRRKARLNKRQTAALGKWYADCGNVIQHQKKLALIANPVSGGGKWLAAKADIINTLSPHYDVAVYETSAETSAFELAMRAAEQGTNVLVAGGGDGTVNEVARVAIAYEIPLGILPLGTANALAHVFFGWESKVLPVHSACQAIAQGRWEHVDTGECNGELMLVAAGLGIEEHMISFAHREQKNALGQVAYLQGFFNGMNQHESQCYTLKLDGNAPFSIRTRSLVIANAAPSTTVLAQGLGAPDYEDGLLDLTWFTEQGNENKSLTAVGSLALAAVTDDVSSNTVAHQKARTIEIEAEEGQIHYVIDGELKESTRLVLTARPQSLKVFLPAGDTSPPEET